MLKRQAALQHGGKRGLEVMLHFPCRPAQGQGCPQKKLYKHLFALYLPKAAESVAHAKCPGGAGMSEPPADGSTETPGGDNVCECGQMQVILILYVFG